MAISNLTGQKTYQSFRNLMQISSSGQVYDGLGNLVTSLQLTASFVSGSSSGGGTGAGFPFSGSAVITGSLLVSSSLTVTGSVRIRGTLNVVGSQTMTGSLNILNTSPSIQFRNSGSAGAGQISIMAQDDTVASKSVGQTVFSINTADSTNTVMGGIVYTKASNSATNTSFNYNNFANTAIYISGSGNVGIRTTTPNSASLHVSGSVFATSFTGSLFGTSSWSQNSISSSYPLRVIGSNLISTYVPGGVGSVGNDSIFIGSGSGAAVNANYSTFLGYLAGFQATNAGLSNFLGNQAGFGATNASNSNFIGASAGYSASLASNSNFLGINAGQEATYATTSNFFGPSAGLRAVNAQQSNFFGFTAGEHASSASFSTLIGYGVGTSYLQVTDAYVPSIGSNNIIIGTNITLQSGRKDSINLGAIIFATGSYSDPDSNVFSGSLGTGKVGINNPNPNYTLDISGSVNFTGDIYQNGIPFQEKYMWYNIRIEDTSLKYNNSPSVNPNQSDIPLNSLLPYTYVDIIDQNHRTTYTSLTFTDISDIATYITNNSITYGHAVIYSIKNNTGNLRVGGVNLFSTEIAVRGRAGKVSNKRPYDVNTESSVYSTLTQALSSSLVSECSQIVPNFSGNYINQDQVEAIVAAPDPNASYTYFSFAAVNKYKKRQFSRHYVGAKTVGIDVDGNDINLSNPNQAKVLGVAVYEWFQDVLYFRTFITNYGYSSQNKEKLGPQNEGGSMLNVYIVQTSDNCRALVVEPIGIDRILTPPSFDKISEINNNPILPNLTIYRKGNITQVADYESRVDARLGISTYLAPELFSANFRVRSIHEVDVINLYSDRTCDLFEKAIKLDKLKYTPKKYINLTLLNSNYQKN
jgi:hypothetical protein